MSTPYRHVYTRPGPRDMPMTPRLVGRDIRGDAVLYDWQAPDLIPDADATARLQYVRDKARVFSEKATPPVTGMRVVVTTEWQALGSTTAP